MLGFVKAVQLAHGRLDHLVQEADIFIVPRAVEVEGRAGSLHNLHLWPSERRAPLTGWLGTSWIIKGTMIGIESRPARCSWSRGSFPAEASVKVAREDEWA